MAPAAVLVVVFFVVPLLQVLWLSVSEPTLGFQNYAALFDNPLLRRVWLNTLRICALTTVIAVVAGYLVAYAMAHVGERHRAMMVFCIVLTFWLSVLVRAFAWVMLLRTEGTPQHRPHGARRRRRAAAARPERDRRARSAWSHYMLPVAVLPMYSNMRTISGRYVDAARGLGASGRGRPSCGSTCR